MPLCPANSLHHDQVFQYFVVQKPPQPCPFCFWGALELSQCVYGLRLKALPRLVEASVNSAICTRASEKTVKVNNGCKWTNPPISLVLFHRTLEHLPYLFGWWGKELNGRTLRMSKSLASTLDQYVTIPAQSATLMRNLSIMKHKNFLYHISGISYCIRLILLGIETDCSMFLGPHMKCLRQPQLIGR